MSEKRIKSSSAKGMRESDSRTDWSRVDAQTDRAIDERIESDEDWAEFGNVDWSQAVIVVPNRKQAISIRLDPDVLEYFRAQGPGYQSRINAVLRAFVRDRLRKAG
ncbi:MAG: BrnA antitoxin family protein [Bauldia sp.]|nr:BrnA antitoxin family protein [Bauldia sp.]